ncbi:lipoprotein-releasing ABC transporter permease subunit [Thermodesulfobacteriota bacterium]
MFELLLGLRYLKAKRKQAVFSIITVISVAGVMVGVMGLIVVLSVMNGFRADLMNKILGVNAHLLVRNYSGELSGYEKILNKITDTDGVIAVTPAIYSQVMVNSTGRASGAVFRGIDTNTAGDVIDIKPMVKEGLLNELDKYQGGLPSIIVGNELARQIGVIPGDTLTAVSPEGKLTPLGRTPNSRKYRVAGLFNSGMYEYDLTMVFVSLKEAQDFLGTEDKISVLEIKVDDIYKSDVIGESIQQTLGYPYWVQDWKHKNSSLFSALKLEKITMFIILTMIVLVGALNIISTLVMVVMEKTRDISILRAMGATKKSIMSIFMLQGLIVGFIGTIAGLVFGLGICHILDRYKFIELPADVYYITTLPVKVETLDVLLVTLAAVAISFLATLYPSWHASRLDPVEALRYE